eukprot:IDg20337t1
MTTSSTFACAHDPSAYVRAPLSQLESRTYVAVMPTSLLYWLRCWLEYEPWRLVIFEISDSPTTAMTTRIAAFCAPCASAARPRACSDTAAAPRTHHETAASRKPPATVTVAAAGALAPLANLFERAGRVRCPFWRRRATDALEAATMVLRWGAARHASLLPLPATAAAAPYGPALPISVRVARLRDDFERRQYYVTGRLSRELYSPTMRLRRARPRHTCRRHCEMVQCDWRIVLPAQVTRRSVAYRGT